MSKDKKFSPFLKQSFVTAAIAINIIGTGCSLGYPAILLPQLAQSNIHLDAKSMSWIASVLGITQIFSSFITSPIMSRYGRRIAHFAILMPMIVSWLVIIQATGFTELLLGRILQGFSIGMLAPLRSVLLGEYSSPKYRGGFLTMISLSQSIGIFFVHLSGSLLSWQQTALCCMFFSFISLVMTIYTPESPSWLVSKGRYEEAREVFRWLRGDEEEEELEEMIEARIHYEREIIYQKSSEKQNNFSEIMDMVKQKEFYKPIILMMHAYVLMNFAGGTTMASYPTVIITLVMGPGVNAHFWMVLLDAQRLISNFIAIFVINKFKRRTMMFATGGLSIFSQFAIAAYVYYKQNNTLPSDALWIPIILINLKFFAIATGILPIPNVIGGEVFPLRFRNIGASISLIAQYATFFLVLKTFPGMVEGIGIHGTYIVYGGVLSYCMSVIWFMLPETKGKTLQQIEDEFRGRPLAPQEIEARMSLQSNPVENSKIKMTQSQSGNNLVLTLE